MCILLQANGKGDATGGIFEAIFCAQRMINATFSRTMHFCTTDKKHTYSDK